MSNTVRLVWQKRPDPPASAMIDLDAPVSDGPLISCIMATRGNAFPARHAIGCFQRQSYGARELVIVCASAGSEVEALVATLDDPHIRFLHAPEAQAVGELRNLGVAKASGEYVCVWDDDDLSHPDRLRWQLAGLVAAKGDACFLSHILLWQPARARLAVANNRTWENTLLARKAGLPPYTGGRTGSDTILAEALIASRTVVTLEQAVGYCYVAHGGNLWSDAHFDMLFDHADRVSTGEAYAKDLALLSRVMPFDAYAEQLAALPPQPPPR